MIGFLSIVSAGCVVRSEGPFVSIQSALGRAVADTGHPAAAALPVDSRGIPFTAASAEAVQCFDSAISGYLGLRLDTGKRLERAFAADPDFAMAHILRGYFGLLFGRRDYVARAARSLAAGAAAIGKRAVTAREAAHHAALAAWVAGDLDAAVAHWRAILRDHPRDVLAVRLLQHGNFYLGDSAGLRDDVAQVLHAWDDGVPACGFVYGCHAFGLEETGDYAGAERAGRRAVELNPRDIWSAHAVAHVFEMQNRIDEGLAWLDGLAGEWGEVNNFVYHVQWHRCLLLLECQRYDEVLAAYDREVRAESTEDQLDISNAVALLWRLEQAGIAVGSRWDELAARSATRLADHLIVLPDIHYVMALAAKGDDDSVAGWLQASRSFATTSQETAARIMDEVGLALGQAALAHRAGRWQAVLDHLLPVKDRVRRIGGSHAQRDLFERMLIDAALKAGNPAVARDLLARRAQLRTQDRWGRQQALLAAEGQGDPSRA
jgi:tetratricopeptide (TPR) repeat protein